MHLLHEQVDSFPLRHQVSPNQLYSNVTPILQREGDREEGKVWHDGGMMVDLSLSPYFPKDSQGHLGFNNQKSGCVEALRKASMF